MLILPLPSRPPGEASVVRLCCGLTSPRRSLLCPITRRLRRRRKGRPSNEPRARPSVPEGGATPILATNPRRPGNALLLSRARPRGGCRSGALSFRGCHAGLPVSGRAAAPGSASGIGRNARGGNQRPEPFGLSPSPPGPGRRHAEFLPEVSWTPSWGKAGRGSSRRDSHKAVSSSKAAFSSSWKGQKSPPLTRWRICSFLRKKCRHLTSSPEFRMR